MLVMSVRDGLLCAHELGRKRGPSAGDVRGPGVVSTSAENRQKRGNAEIINYLQDAAGARNLAFGLAVTHDRYGSSAQSHLNSLLIHPRTSMHRCALLHAKRSVPTAHNMPTIVTCPSCLPSPAHPHAAPGSR